MELTLGRQKIQVAMEHLLEMQQAERNEGLREVPEHEVLVGQANLLLSLHLQSPLVLEKRSVQGENKGV